MKKSVLNKQGNFGVKILWRYTDMAIFVLRCFILTHPVQHTVSAGTLHGVFLSPVIFCNLYKYICN